MKHFRNGALLYESIRHLCHISIDLLLKFILHAVSVQFYHGPSRCLKISFVPGLLRIKSGHIFKTRFGSKHPLTVTVFLVVSYLDYTTFTGFLFIGTLLDIGVWYNVKDLKIYDDDDGGGGGFGGNVEKKSLPVDANSNTDMAKINNSAVNVDL